MVGDPVWLSAGTPKHSGIIRGIMSKLVSLVTGLFRMFSFTKKGRDANCADGQGGVCAGSNYSLGKTPQGVSTQYYLGTFNADEVKHLYRHLSMTSKHELANGVQIVHIEKGIVKLVFSDVEWLQIPVSMLKDALYSKEKSLLT